MGGSASLSVAASGGVSLSYQWYSNTTNNNSGGTLISGATSATYAAPTVTAGTTYYFVVVTNTDSSATGNQTATSTSSVATVTVNALTHAAAPSIDTQPADKTVNVGGSASLSVAASGGVSLSYQWYSNTTNSTSGGTLIAGATSAAYAAPTGTAGTKHYYVVVTNTDSGATGNQTATVTSSVATVTVNALTHAAAPSIDTQPADKTVNVGGSASLSVAASGGVSLSYQWYSNTTNSTSGGTLIAGATSAAYAAPTGTAGTKHYYVVVTNTDSGATGNQTATATSNAVTVTVNALTHAVMPSIDTQPADKTVNVGGSANLSVAASGGVSLSYQWYSNTTNNNSGGNLIAGATSAAYAAPTGTAGTKHYYVLVTNTDSGATGNQTATATSNAVTVTVNVPSPSGNLSPSTPSDLDVIVLVNGKAENLGKMANSIRDNQTMSTFIMDQKKLEELLKSEAPKSVVTVVPNVKSDILVGELDGQMIKNMEDRQAILQIKTDRATYTLPALQFNIRAIADQFGNSVTLQNVKVRIEIATPISDTVKVVENAAMNGSFALVVPPLSFSVKVTYGDTTIEVSKFSAYVERTVAIPDGVDPSKVTTGVVIEPNGTVRHVPTKVVKIDGKLYAVINSLTNSTYSVVWHPLEFSDMAKHWAKDAVNDMGSRMVIDGAGNGMFSPDRNITRAEFAAILVRGLGLQLENGTATFSDVKATDWYSSAVNTAYAYRLIDGYEDGTFRPMEKITREQAMTILSKALAITGLKQKLSDRSADSILKPFKDAAQVSVWAQSGVADCVQAGVVSGRTDGALAPKAYMTRAEVATIIQRLLQLSDLI
ncbi:S-layer homology domain-containing protein [Cohnella endophytica]|uniref:S-layer homology domain-containing protein n=1 Tax=Cohnella endophytica TaxID=2419778 RepID=A0A494Y2D3_9BACL|nr:S-layer homology domain-containing protein [Cohnella endophytica]